MLGTYEIICKNLGKIDTKKQSATSQNLRTIRNRRAYKKYIAPKELPELTRQALDNRLLTVTHKAFRDRHGHI